jgi:hypothetical protein
MVMRLIKSLADNREMDSLATRMRRRRFALFTSLLDQLPRPLTILDVGGTERFWQTMNYSSEGLAVTLLNISPARVGLPNFNSIVGDACSMSFFGNQAFDVVFSNSVIEHVGTYASQRRMAQEIMRVGKHYFVQTPNLYFPLEPHFLFPFFQFLPLSVRTFLVNHFALGWRPRFPDKAAARAEVESIQLLDQQRLVALFPGSTLYKERFLGMNKSFIVYGGRNW